MIKIGLAVSGMTGGEPFARVGTVTKEAHAHMEEAAVLDAIAGALWGIAADAYHVVAFAPDGSVIASASVRVDAEAGDLDDQELDAFVGAVGAALSR